MKKISNICLPKSLRRFTRIYVIDAEFLQMPGEKSVPRCVVAWEILGGKTYRRWIANQGQSPEPPPGWAASDTLVVTFFGSAEAQVFLTLGWSLPQFHVDLFVEHGCLTNGSLRPHGRSLLGAMADFGLNPMAAAEKQEKRALAMRPGGYSPEEQKELLDYCEEDVAATAQLFQAMKEHIDLPYALLRGLYANVIGEMEWRGTPCDSEALRQLSEKVPVIKKHLTEEVDRSFGVFEQGVFKQSRWLEYVRARGIDWPLLPSGAPSLSEATFKEMATTHPEIEPMKDLRKALAQLNGKPIPVGADGRNRSMISPFASKTGRNQPKAGLLFAAPKWLRGFIQPKSGMALGHSDYEQQEFGIAAALSRDEQMREAYLSGDPYLAFGKQAGIIPADATSETHSQLREQCKSCALGIQYGMGEQSLARKINQSPTHAQWLIERHKRAFPAYWEWQQAVEDKAVLKRELKTAFGWVIRPKGKINLRSIRNFPLQANGADMLRIACIYAAGLGVKICAPLHDALLIESEIETIDEAVQQCEHAMIEASKLVLNGFALRVSSEVIRHPDHFPVKGGKQIWNLVQEVLRHGN